MLNFFSQALRHMPQLALQIMHRRTRYSRPLFYVYVINASILYHRPDLETSCRNVHSLSRLHLFIALCYPSH